MRKYNFITKKLLIREYSKDRKSPQRISKEIGCSTTPIYNRLRKYNIKMRTMEQACKTGSNYIDGRYSKTYYCIESNCNNRICYWNWRYGQKRCYSCANRGKRNVAKKLETRKNMSRTRKNKTYEEFYGIKKAKKIKKLRSKSHKGNKNHFYGRPVRAKWGIYKGIMMRSSWEIKFAYFLNLSGIKWQYESITFDLGNTTYTPDFYVPEWDCYIEIKGYASDIFQQKIELFKRKYSNINIKILMEKDLQELGILS